MKLITRDTDYALRALVFMAKQLERSRAKVVSVDMIVEEERLPRVFLRRLLQQLAREKMLSSYKGRGGGFSFLRPPDKIRLTDIITIFQGPVDLIHCFLGEDICPKKTGCKARKRITAVSDMLNKELDKITISSLI